MYVDFHMVVHGDGSTQGAHAPPAHTHTLPSPNCPLYMFFFFRPAWIEVKARKQDRVVVLEMDVYAWSLYFCYNYQDEAMCYYLVCEVLMTVCLASLFFMHLNYNYYIHGSGIIYICIRIVLNT